jgi:iron complex outermembrane receptor protein
MYLSSMKIFSFLVCFLPGLLSAQHLVFVQVISEKGPLASATVEFPVLKTGFVTAGNGIAYADNIPAGQHEVRIRYVGLTEKVLTIAVPAADTIRVELEAAEEELEPVFVSSTRSTRTIENEPVRVEIIAGEELDEKSTMKPGELRMLLTESTGIQTQTTSAGSGNASIRIQGLDGRYTLLLRDGMPVFNGAASGLGLLQIPPLDLQQVEVIKGPASTLYGGGAIAGLVNLITKTPGERPETNLMYNRTSANGDDLSAFLARKFEHTGFTFFGSYNDSDAYDPADIGLSAIPKFNRITIAPRFFWYPSNDVTFNAGVHYTREGRRGGSMDWPDDDNLLFFKTDVAPPFFERNNTERTVLNAGADWNISKTQQLRAKASYVVFDRNQETPFSSFIGTQHAVFGEVSHHTELAGGNLVSGANLWTDTFDDRTEWGRNGTSGLSYSQRTAGVFTQFTRPFSEIITLETGLRADYVENYRTVLLPHVSLLIAIAPGLTSRIGGGPGYKTPTLFTEDAERRYFRDILPPDPASLTLERSLGFNADINYSTTVFDLASLTINQLFFHTGIRNRSTPGINRGDGYFAWTPEPGRVVSRGAETNLKVEAGGFTLFTGYSFTDVNILINGTTEEHPLSPRHRLNSFLMYEKEDDFRIGLEAYYTGTQRLNDGSQGKDYLILGFMAQKYFERFSLFVNFENFTDQRQTSFDTIFTRSATSPDFRDIYAPLDGFLINGGVMVRL